MGVQGLWSLLEPVGRPVRLENLEGKVLAIDISVWLHQSLKGLRDQAGDAIANPHLLGLLNRICKLLYYRIKPIFVFDGKAPLLKKQTIRRRRQTGMKAQKTSANARVKLIENYIRSRRAAEQARSTLTVNKDMLNNVLNARKKKTEKDIFELPQLDEKEEFLLLDDDEQDRKDLMAELNVRSDTDLHQIDLKDKKFLTLPVHLQAEFLIELREKRKQNSWKKMHEMPQVASDFSSFQMERLKKRSAMHKCLDDVAAKAAKETSLQLDDKLFVGDLEGLRKQKKIKKDIAGIDFAYVETERVNKDNDSNSDDESELEILQPSDPEFARSSRRGGGPVATCRDEASASESKSSETKNDPGGHFQSEDIFAQLFESSNTRDSCGADIPTNRRKNPSKIIIKPDEYDEANDMFADVFESTAASREERNSPIPTVDELSNESQEEAVKERTNLKRLVPAISSPETGVKRRKVGGQVPSPVTSTTEVGKPVHGEIASKGKDNCIEITVDTDNFDESDDIFADIFTDDAEESKVEKSVQNAETMQFLTSTNAENPATTCKAPTTDESERKDVTLPAPAHEGYKKTQTTKDKQSLTPEVVYREEKSAKDRINLEDVIKKPIRNERKKSPSDDKVLPSTSLGYQGTQTEDTSGAKSSVMEGKRANVVYSASAPSFVRSMRHHTEEVKVLDGEDQDLFFDMGPSVPNDALSLSEEELYELQEKLAKERQEIIAERNRSDRLAATLSDQMYKDCQELLQLFGLPWIVAPEESEAECAYLDFVGISNGTVTDDSDIWLFGGKTVYKNFFSQGRPILQFKREDVENHFGLSRQKLASLAMLTGSDYTEGIHTVGPVTAMEILAEFPGRDLEPLRSFRRWHEEQREARAQGINKHHPLEKLSKLKLPEDFPSDAVFNAYMYPELDLSTDIFSWAVPNFVEIRDFVAEKFGWPRRKIDEVLSPVIRRLKEKSVQTSIDSYLAFKPGEVAAKTSSQRVRKAIRKAAKHRENIL